SATPRSTITSQVRGLPFSRRSDLWRGKQNSEIRGQLKLMFATIYLPNFYLQAALRHQSELRAKPVALIEEQENKPLIIQLNEAAQTAGIRKGMTPSQELARYLHVVIDRKSVV